MKTKIEKKSIKSRPVFFLKTLIIYKLLTILIETKERSHNTPILGMKQDIITVLPDIKRLREYYKQLYRHKIDNLDKMNDFLKKTQTTKAHTI